MYELYRLIFDFKCDAQLPSCANCLSADVECLFFDDSSEQQIPRRFVDLVMHQVYIAQVS
jgi:hypothetical protein